MFAGWLPTFKPQLIESLKTYTLSDFRADAAAGLVVGIVALPLAMAFAIASGVSPQSGIVTAMIAGFLISALGGTRLCIGGPTGAFIVILYGIAVKYGVANLLVCTFMAGVMLVLMGAAFYFLLIRPQQKRSKQQQEMTNSLEPGTRVMLSSGVFGTIRHLGERQAIIEIAPGIEMTVVKQAVEDAVGHDEARTIDGNIHRGLEEFGQGVFARICSSA